MSMRYNTIPEYKYKHIIRSIENKISKLKSKNKDFSKYNFNLSFDDANKLFNDKCYYCNIKEDKYLNGIDRFVNNIGYEKYNCVSCCKICNYIKFTTDPFIFIYIIKHILVYNKMIEGKLYNNIFPNTKEVTYDLYYRSSKKRKILFSISPREFNTLIYQNCYICGKESNINHINGIDRFNNKIGYVFDNLRPCCHICNFMKKNLSYNDFFNHLLKIYNNNSIDNEEMDKIIDNLCISDDLDISDIELYDNTSFDINNQEYDNIINELDQEEFDSLIKDDN
jgi:hypothetical protein